MEMELSARTLGAGARSGSGRQRGMSIIEVVLASLILLILALGIIPLFTRSMASNASGADSTRVSNMATERVEQLLQLPFDSAELTLPEGAPSLVTEEVYTREDEAFIAGTEADAVSNGKLPLWTRTTTIQQFNVNDLDTPIEGSPPTNPDPSAQIKRIEVTVAGLREGGPLGVSKSLTVRVMKSP